MTTRDLQALCDSAHAAWPDVDVSDEVFMRHVDACVRDGALPPERHAADLYLACACSHANAAALRAFDDLLKLVVTRAVSRLDSSPSFRDTVTQDLRTRLLIGTPPKLAEYAGQSSLATWLRTVAVRTALNSRRGKVEEAHDSVGSNAWIVTAGPEMELVRARFRVEHRRAIEVALTHLSTQERAMLCLNVRDGLSIDKLAVVYGVGRSTAARCLSSARATLERETRRELMTRLKLTPSEFQSLGAAVQSDLEVSLVEMLQGEAG